MMPWPCAAWPRPTTATSPTLWRCCAASTFLPPRAVARRGRARTVDRDKPNAVEVLRGSDLSVAPGEVVALVAPSGAGKSTLLHIAGLLDSPDEGEALLAGPDMTRLGGGA